jgi:hypothetical protein
MVERILPLLGRVRGVSRLTPCCGFVSASIIGLEVLYPFLLAGFVNLEDWK